MDNRTCSIDGCTGPVRARGWCIKHWKRWKKYGDPEHPVRDYVKRDATCSIDACTNPTDARGLCRMHWQRWRVNGSPGRKSRDSIAETAEQWRPVVGYEGYYEISDLGRVWSVPRVGVSGGLRSPYLRGGPYLLVRLTRDGVHRQYPVHRVVGEAFLGPLPPAMQTCHGPGGKQDNRLANLSYGTPTENSNDQIRDGTRRRGEQRTEAKLTFAVVAACRVRYAAGETQVALAQEFGVSRSCMGFAIAGKRRWKPLA